MKCKEKDCGGELEIFTISHACGECKCEKNFNICVKCKRVHHEHGQLAFSKDGRKAYQMEDGSFELRDE